ncbi:hypothetical protein [Gordonia insulae]|uniref:Scaffolding protein n=1 Tax=Gordonia insulae TaxID=2420509 RepID=A0A3G8JKS6_9ACTN|nr:hypothetical protein [Gordonia insulae]AZG44820.1 hypothetical protein D7316_01411 [Gordonia insulae]
MTMPNDTTTTEDDEMFDGAIDPAAEAPPATEDGQPTYDDVVAERDYWADVAKAAGAGKAGAESVKYRQQLRDAEAEMTELRDHLSAANEVLFAIAAERVGVPAETMVARGITAEGAAEGVGVLDIDVLAEAMEAERLVLQMPRRPRPNPNVGNGTGYMPQQPSGKAAWDAAFGVSR